MDHLSSSLLNTLTAQPLDRSAHGRKDSDWLIAQSNDRSAEFLVLNGNVVVTVDRVPLILSHAQYQALYCFDSPLLLGTKKSDNTPVFSVNVTDPEEGMSILSQALVDQSILDKSIISSGDGIEGLSLREIAKEIDHELASMYSYATLLNHWHLTTRFCSCCGTSLKTIEGGSAQQCSNESCAHIDYPRINPAVIMRITKGDKILLARQENWPEKMFSVLAGFVEVGETLEHAVEREVMEEVNIAVSNINYHSSQPWPFPNSMMLGYTAEANSEAFDLEQDDIDEAMWLTAEEFKAKMSEGSVSPPFKLSISYRLIDDWFQAQTGTSIKEFKSTLPQS